MSETCHWHAYRIILRLHTPLHIGNGRIGYLQRTRPYVTARVLRGALVTALTRLQPQPQGALDDDATYRKVGKTIYQHLAFTYLYPALQQTHNTWQPCLPWNNETDFRHRFLSSYTAAALTYPQQTAAEGQLYETEFISPHTLDTGDPVYLFGYIFAMQSDKLAWQQALQNGIQLGGERAYGWGRVSLAHISPPLQDSQGKFDLFGASATLQIRHAHPFLHLPQESRIVAHAATQGAPISGVVEPLVGREWRSEGSQRKHIGQHLNFDNLCYAPGSLVQQGTTFKIGKGGVWYAQPTNHTQENTP